MSSRAVTVVDIDNNGYIDVVVGNFGQRNRFYLNNGPVHDYVANAHRNVGEAYGLPNTEAVMSTAQATKEAHRQLTHDDVATMRYAMSGFDEVQGNSDDFTYTIKFLGLTDQADIVIDFDTAQVQAGAMASTVITAVVTHGSKRIQIFDAQIFFREETSWFFNDQLESAIVFADFGHSGIEDGTQDFPFNTVAEALADVAIGGTIEFAIGDSTETPTVDQEVFLTAAGGSVRIGVVAARSARDETATPLPTKEQDSQTGFVSRSRP